jgi:DNA-binding LacI/PurR family transcriptional regulator
MNLEEVARRAGVSTATVSRVLNNVDVVRKATRARVMKAIEDLRYQPNLHARTLAGGKSRTIGLIVSNMANPFFIDIFRTLESDAHAHGYEVVIANTDYRPEQLVASVRLMIGRRVAGLAAMISEMDPDLIDELASSNIPCVFYDVGAARHNITNIRVSYSLGIDKIVDYLHELGHRRMAFIGHHATLAPLDERRKAFMDALGRYQPGVDYRISLDADSLEGGRQAARQLLSTGFEPTAIICANDLMALGVLRELRDRSLRVPEDVSVTGFDDIQFAEFCSPALTTVHIPRDRIGHIASESLIPHSRETFPTGREIVIEPEFVLRDSTGPARR